MFYYIVRIKKLMVIFGKKIFNILIKSWLNAQTVSPYWLNMVEGYREYDEGQQTYQVYKYEWIGGMVNAPEPNKNVFWF